MHKLDSISMGKIVQIRERLFKAQAAGKKVYRFESGDPSFSVSDNVLEGIIQAAKAGKTHYIPNDGIPELRKELKLKLERKNGIHLPSIDPIFVTNGAMHALYVLWQVLLGEGDEVIFPDPMWTEAVENSRLAGGVPVPVPLKHEEGYQYSASQIAARITAKTTAIFLNSPHNPTGAVLSKETLLEILDLAHKKNLYVVTDEAYEDIVYDARHYSLAALAEGRYPEEFQRKIISVFSYSKSYAMSGLRVGYLVVREPHLQERISKLLRCTINGVNSVAQWAAIEALRSGPEHLDMMKKEYRHRRDVLLKALSGIPGVEPFKPEGAFYVWCRLDPSLYAKMGAKDADGISNLLAEKGLGNAPGDSFGVHCLDAIRFAYSCATPMIDEGSVELRKFFTAQK